MSASLRKPAIHRDGGATISPSGEPFLLGSILFITALAYAGTLRFPFVYEDQDQIAQNVLVQSWRFLPQYFHGSGTQHLSPSGNEYHPLYLIWSRINDAVFGLRPAGWHAAAILMHVLATFLIYRVARRLTGKPLMAAVAALLFGVHPMRHDVVAWVSGVSESLWSVWFLLAFLAYLRWRDGRRLAWIAASCALYAAALLSKEAAIVLPLVIFAHACIYDGPAGSSAWPNSRLSSTAKAARIALLYVPVAIGYAVLRFAFLHGPTRPHTPVPFRSAFLTVPSVLFFYVKQWLLPIHVAEFYDLPLRSRFDVVHVLLPALLLAALAASLWILREKLGARDVSFALVWIAVLLLPALAFRTFPSGELVHDRYFYLASFGGSFLVALVLEKLASGALVFGLPRAWLLATLVFLVLLSYGTAHAAKYWADNDDLFEHAYQIAPSNDAARIHYAMALSQSGDYGTAVPLLRQILVEQPHNALANYSLGRISYEVGLLPPATMYLEQARADDPLFPDTYLQLALIDLKRYNLPEADANLRRAIQLAPLEPSFRFALGITLRHEGNCSASKEQLYETVALKADFPHVREEIHKCDGRGAQNLSEGAPHTPSIEPDQRPAGGRKSQASAIARTGDCRFPGVCDARYALTSETIFTCT